MNQNYEIRIVCLMGRCAGFNLFKNWQSIAFRFQVLPEKTLRKIFALWNIYDVIFVGWLWLAFLCVCMCLFIHLIFLQVKASLVKVQAWHSLATIYQKETYAEWSLYENNCKPYARTHYGWVYIVHTKTDHAQKKKNKSGGFDWSTPFRCNWLIQ